MLRCAIREGLAVELLIVSLLRASTCKVVARLFCLVLLAAVSPIGLLWIIRLRSLERFCRLLALDRYPTLECRQAENSSMVLPTILLLLLFPDPDPGYDCCYPSLLTSLKREENGRTKANWASFHHTPNHAPSKLQFS